MKVNRILSGLICTAIISSSFAVPVFAAEDINNTQDEVVYQIDDVNNNSVITYTQGDIEEGSWNTDALGEDSPYMYGDFPVRITSDVDYYSNMNLEFDYLKRIADFDSVKVDITDYYTQDSIYSNTLADDYKVVLTDVELDKFFNVKVTESKDGTDTEYVRIVRTYAKTADMPNNVSVEPVEEFDGVAAVELHIIELNEEDEEIIVNDGNEYEYLHTRNSYTIMPEEFPDFYNSLPEDKLYKIFAYTNDAVVTYDYKGFISTFEGGRERNVYTPGYMIYKPEELAAKPNRVPPIIHDYENHGRWRNDQRFTASEVKAKGDKTVYNILDDRTLSISGEEDSDTPYMIFSFNVWETMPFYVEVTGGDFCVNIETWTSMYVDGKYQEPYYSETLFATGKAAYTFESLPCKMYYAVYFTDKNSTKRYIGGRAELRITATQYKNDRDNYFTDMIGDADLYMTNNEWKSGTIDYVGDVDLFYLNNTNENGKFWFSVENSPSDAGAKRRSDYALVMKLCKVWAAADDTRYLRSELTQKEVAPGQTKTFIFTLEPGYDYFVYIYSVRPTKPLSEGDKFRVKVMSPSTGDTYEENNSFETATQIEGVDDNINDAWLHKNDADFYKFTTTEPRILFAGLSAVDRIVYNLSLYDSNQNVLATATKDTSNAYIGNVKIDPGTYYVKVDSSGLGDTAYFLEGMYRLYVAADDFYAEFDNPVNLSYNAGDTFNINNYWSSILAEVTCRVGSMKYRREEVTDNSQLFVMNGSNKLPFTAETLASLPNGTYTVIMEFFGKASTGQPITLTVTGSSASAGDTVVLNTVIMEPNANANWHWAACAKMMANSRLRREGSAVSTLSLAQGINGAFGSSHLTRVGDIEDTAQLASYFYCGNKESYNFINGTVSLDGFEQSVLGVLKTGQAIIAKLENASSGSVKYVVIYGVNTGTHQYKIMDPQGSVDTWIDAENLYSGYGGDAGMVFDGQVVECL